MGFTRAGMVMQAQPLTLLLVVAAQGDTLDVVVMVVLLVIMAVQDQAVAEVVVEGLLMVMEEEQGYLVKDVMGQEVLLVHRQEVLVQGALVCYTGEGLLLVSPHKHIVAGLLVPFVLYGPETIVHSHQLL
jgi:hypothetical protein